MLRGQFKAPFLATPSGWLIPFFALIALLIPGSAFGQSGTDTTGTGGRHIIQGRIHYPSGQRVDTRPIVHLEGSNTGGLSVMSDANGFFSFTSLAPGNYTVVVEGDQNYETAREGVYIDQDIQGPPGVTIPSFTRPYTVDIELRPKRSAVQPSQTGVIDASLAAIPEAARTIYQQGMESARLGKHDDAVQQFLSAIAQYPQFPQAYNELGVQYLFLNQLDKAVEALRLAVRFAPDSIVPRLNLGKALYNANRLGDSETEIQAAIKKSDTDWTAHYYLGRIHIIQKRYDEAEKNMLRAVELGGNDAGLPHYYLGGLYMSKGENKRAADELEHYLQLNPKAENAERVRQSIKELRGKNS